MAYQFDDYLNQSEDLLVAAYKTFLSTNGITNAFVQAQRYADLYVDGQLKVDRIFSNIAETIPYVLVTLTNGGESILGFGSNTLGGNRAVTLTLQGPLYNVANQSLIIISSVSGTAVTIDFPTVLFADATRVALQDFYDVVKVQLPSNWGITFDTRNVYITANNDDLDVVQGAFGVTTGTYSTAVVSDKALLNSGVLTFEIGCESASTRKGFIDLLLIWIQTIREAQGTISNNANLNIILNSTFKTTGEQDVTIGTDAINKLYIASVQGQVLIEAQNTVGMTLQPITGVYPLI